MTRSESFVSCDTGISVRDIEINKGIRGGKSKCHTAVADDSTEIVPLPKLGTTSAMLLCRLVLAPAVMFPLVYYSMRLGVIQDRMVGIVLIVESGAPSAQTMIVCCNSLGLQRAAGQMSVLYAFQYLVSVLTITIWTTLALTYL